MTACALYCRHVVHSAGSDGNTEWRFLTSCPQVLQVLKECCGKHFTHKNGQDEYPLNCSHSTHNMTLWCIQNLKAFLSDFLFTLCAQSDAPTYMKLKWLFYLVFLFTLHAQRDAPMYTSTTDQCGARSGSPQINN